MELLQALWSLKGGAQNSVKLLTVLFRRAVSKSNAQDLSCWCSLGQVLRTDGGLSQIERLPGLDEDEKLLNLFQ